MQTASQVKLDFYIRVGVISDIERIMELQTENSILHLNPLNLHLKGGLEILFTPSDLKKMITRKSIYVATTMLKNSDEVQPEYNLSVIGYIIILQGKMDGNEEARDFFMDFKDAILILQIAVDQNFRRKSVGTKLIETIEKFNNNIVAFAAKDNALATGMFKKNNFIYSERGNGRAYWNNNIINVRFQKNKK